MKTTRASLGRPLAAFTGLGLSLGLALALATPCGARNTIRNSFFSIYPNAVGTPLDTVPSKPGHCAVCHYDASGGGAKNPYGNAIASYGNLNQEAGRITAINGVANLDSDGDAFNSQTEITNTTYSNTPTFPGLSSANVNLVTGLTISQISAYLTPATTVDNTPPNVTVLSPNGGETLVGNHAYNVTWTASDASGIAAIHIYQSIDGGLNWTPVIFGLENTGTYSWTPANRPSTTALIKVVAVDGAVNLNNDVSNSAFTIISPSGGKVPTTLRDFDMPGTQPFEAGSEPAPPQQCAQCHGGYDAGAEPYANWQGSMMALASIDPLFEANMVIANQDAPDSGDLCLRCHISGGWMQGRSVPTDGSAMLERDMVGVSCDLCHRMVDPVFDVDLSPARDQQVLADLGFPGEHYGNGMFVLDPDGILRGPRTESAAPHAFRASSFHKSSNFCGTCHDVSNPAFSKDGLGIYQPNTFDQSAGQVDPAVAAPVERTYSEWLHSAYNSPEGVYQPEFAGTKPDGRVATCQDCHMRDVTAKACNLPDAPLRSDMPLHDMTGGSTWIPQLIADLYPEKVNRAAVTAGIARARYMLQNAASLAVTSENGKLKATVTNQTGHKLPTGYPEGRRIWLNVKFYNADDQLISESGAYDMSTGVLTKDDEMKIYEVHPGIGDNIADVVGIPAGKSFHFVLNNVVVSDNRIPPRGFTNAAFASFGGSPVGHTYQDGQYWDDTEYTIPTGAKRAVVRLYYQSTSKEFIEFMRDQNVTDGKGLFMYNLWNDNGKCPPELMEETQWVAPAPPEFAGLAEAVPGIESALLSWQAATSSCAPVTYHVFHSTGSGAQDFGMPIHSTQDLTAVITPLDPGGTSQLTHYFVVRASDDCGGSETNSVELSVQPLLHPDKDQDGDGMSNAMELLYALNPFDSDDAMLDSDNDGLSNLAETALGSHPHDAASANHPVGLWVELENPQERRFAVRYVRRVPNPAASIIVETSDDLAIWQSGELQTTTHQVTDNADGTETVTERMLESGAGARASFLRVKVVPVSGP
jgi:hypothetical protein